MTGPFADRLFRITFFAAGCYNLAFGLWAAIWPLSFFQLFDILPPRYPGIWASLGMVVGVYGLLYWHAAWKLQTAWPIIAVGLLGKVLGPIGMVMSFSDSWPRRLGMICVFNDLIWWLPFGLFLVRDTWMGKRIASLAPWLCVCVHTIAIVTLAFFLQPGTVIKTEIAAERGRYIAGHVTAWTIGWSTWMIAAASLVGFYAWWGCRLKLVGVAVLAVVIAAVGLIFDFSGESCLILLLVEQLPRPSGNSPGDWEFFVNIERAFTLLSAGAANGLYTIGGILLTLATPDLPHWVRAAMWITWLAGISMTVAAVANHRAGLVISTVLLFPPFLIYATWMAARWPAVSSVERRSS